MEYAPPAELLVAGHGFGVPTMHLVAGFLSPEYADELFAQLLKAPEWCVERMVMFGRPLLAPRLSAFYGEPGVAYRYSGVVRPATGWPEGLRHVAEALAASVGWRFNYVLATRYRHGDDRLGWHADDERELGREPVIASLSLGATRMFRVRPRRGGASVGCALAHGSLLLMWGASQRDYKHAVPRTAKPVGERVNLSFRWIDRAPMPGPP